MQLHLTDTFAAASVRRRRRPLPRLSDAIEGLQAQAYIIESTKTEIYSNLARARRCWTTRYPLIEQLLEDVQIALHQMKLGNRYSSTEFDRL